MKLLIELLLLFVLAEAKSRERILCVAGKDAQYYFRRPGGLDDIRACNIIHGNIFIVMMEINNSFVPLSNLTELIGSLNLYSNDRITSLSQLFPNLSAMRRLEAATDATPKVSQPPPPALHLSWNVLLERINLTKLTYMEGSINTVLSEDLCYFNTVNWKSIANYPNSCPPQMSGHNCWESCPSHCPYWKDEKQYCWSENACQYECNCDPVDGSKTFCNFETHECCDPNCLGGCHGPTAADCVACKNWTILETGVCTNSSEGCPPGTLELLNRFCVSRSYCNKLESEPGKLYKIHDNKCLAMCPPLTNEDPLDNVSCIECEADECRRVQVANKTIMYMTDFPELPFTNLVGNLVLNLEELKPSQTSMLESRLKSLRNITGSLKVYRSERIQGLDLFESLEEIGSGGCALSNGFCLTIHSNEFLQRLWRPKKGKLRILNGNISIAHNPRLCQNAIDEFQKYLDPSVYVHQEGNGDRGYCSSIVITPVKILKQRRDQSHSNFKEMENTKWSIAITVAFNLSNTESLLTLSLYYRKAKLNTNLTYYDPAFCDDSNEREAKIWHRHVVSVNFSSPEFWIKEDGIKLFVTNITSPGLEPNSQYGMYALAQYMDGRIAISDIYRFETIAAPPIWSHNVNDVPRSIAKNQTHYSLSVEWPLPNYQNGNITHYIVRYWETNYTLSPVEWHSCFDQKQRMQNRRQSIYSESANTLQMASMQMAPPASGMSDSYSTGTSCGDYQAGDQNVNMMIAALFQKQPSAPPDVNADDVDDMRRRHAMSVHDVLGGDYSEPADGLGRTAGKSPQSLMGLDASGRPTLIRSGRSVDAILLKPSESTESVEERCKKTKAEVEPKIASLTSKNPFSAYEIVCRPAVTIVNLTHFTKYKFEIRACFDPDPVTNEYLCSEPIYFTERTGPHPKADIMTVDMVMENPFITAAENGRAHRQLTIRKPTLINGQILFFSFQYRAAGSSDEMHEICIDDDPKKSTVEYSLAVYHTRYEAQIAVETLNGLGNYSDIFEFNGVVAEIPTVMSVAIGTSAGLLLISAGLLTWYAFVLRRKRNQIAKDGMATPDWISMNPDYPLITSIDIPEHLELEREDIEVLAEIGRGSFGVVYRGLLRLGGVSSPITSRSRCQVAVKSLRCDATLRQRHDFLHEALLLAGLDCHHIVRLKGVVSRTQPIYVVMELMDNGDLKSYLVKHRPDNVTSASAQNVTAVSVTASNGNMRTFSGGSLSVSDFTQIAGEVADGLAYLAARKIVHRDLAARNCLVARDRTVKLGDFGLARDVYDDSYYHLHGRALLPIRWMAPESLRDGVFDTNSDVWSFGVLLWEIVTYGEQPYQGKSNEEVLEAVKQHRQVLNKPKNCPDKFYNLMLRCWQYKPNERPSFIDIVRELLPGLRPDFLKVSYYGSTLGEKTTEDSPRAQHVSKDDTSSGVGVDTPLLSVHSEEKDEDDDEEELSSNSGKLHFEGEKVPSLAGISFGAAQPQQNVYQFSNIL